MPKRQSLDAGPYVSDGFDIRAGAERKRIAVCRNYATASALAGALQDGAALREALAQSTARMRSAATGFDEDQPMHGVLHERIEANEKLLAQLGSR